MCKKGYIKRESNLINRVKHRGINGGVTVLNDILIIKSLNNNSYLTRGDNSW